MIKLRLYDIKKMYHLWRGNAPLPKGWIEEAEKYLKWKKNHINSDFEKSQYNEARYMVNSLKAIGNARRNN